MLGERERGTEVRGARRIVAKRARRTPLLVAAVLVRDEPAHVEVARHPPRRVRIAKPAPKLHPKPGLRVATVVAKAHLQRRLERPAPVERQLVRALQPQAKPTHRRRGGGQSHNTLGAGPRNQRIALHREPESARLAAIEHLASHPARQHREVDVGLERVVVLVAQRERPLAVACNAPRSEALGELDAQIRMEPGQRRIKLARPILRDAVERVLRRARRRRRCPSPRRSGSRRPAPCRRWWEGRSARC